MNDNLKRKGPEDRHTINLSQDHEIDYWTKKFDVSEFQLREAVKHAGKSADKVSKYFERVKKYSEMLKKTGVTS